MKLKVLYIITKSDLGGAQKYVFDLAKNLDPNQFETKILYGREDLRWLSNKIRPWFLFANDWLAVFELAGRFKKEKPDVIHLNSSKAGVVGGLASTIYKISCRVSRVACPKVIFTAHGWVFNPTNHLSPVVRKCYIVLHKVAALFQDAIINVSDYDKSLAIKYRIAPISKLVTIHNGIDPNIPFLEREKARNEILSKISDREKSDFGKPWIGSIGRLTKEKNYETLIETASLCPNINFFVIGNGPEEEKLKKLVTEKKVGNNVFLIAPEGNDAQYLKAFDIFILPSIKEGLPYSLLEAMAAKVPIVATRVGGMTEILENKNNGKTVGALINPQSPEKIAEAITTCLSNPKNTLEKAERARELIETELNLGRMVRETEETYLK